MPAKKNKYAPTSWGAEDPTIDLECPSGQLCQVTRPGVENLIRIGLLDKLDSLTGLVNAKHLQRVKGKVVGVDAKSLLSDAKQLVSVLETMNRVVVHVVQQPPLTLDTDAEPDKIHIDRVDMDDRAFIFQFATGGTGELEAFRKQRDEFAASVDAEQTVSSTS